MFAVIDLETTGLFPGMHDRIIECAVVLLDHDARYEHSWSTLVNPGRDLGPRSVHGITGRQLVLVPGSAHAAGSISSKKS